VGDAHAEVVAIGEMMALLDPEADGPLEDVPGFRLRVAGAEGNVLINLAHLGHRTAFVSAVGGDPFGRLVIRTLREQGVDTEHVVVDPEARTGVFFKERLGDGDRHVHYYRDRSAAATLTPAEVDLERLGLPKVLTVSGVTLGIGLGGGLSEVARRAMSWGAASPDCVVVFDPNLRPSLWDGAGAAAEFGDLIPLVDVLIAGRDELNTLMPDLEAHEAARHLSRSGVDAVVLKDGAQGAVVHPAGEATPISPFPVERVVDSVGAGDAFAAGVISGLLHGWSVQDGARLGAVLGARAVTVSGDWEGIGSGESARHLLDQYTSVFVK
jgi:2-dehydro-3-deoxygluconokinase